MGGPTAVTRVSFAICAPRGQITAKFASQMQGSVVKATDRRHRARSERALSPIIAHPFHQVSDWARYGSLPCLSHMTLSSTGPPRPEVIGHIRLLDL